SRDLLSAASESMARLRDLRRPNVLLRIATGALIAIIVFVAVEALLHLRLAPRWEEFATFLQSSQAIQNVVFLGLAVLFLATGGPSGAIVRTALFAILFMGTVLVYVPYILASAPETAHWTLGPWRYVGLLPLGAGIAGLAWCLRDFALVGRGTPAPFDPPRQLVATGLYRWVRNPMYLSALSLLVGEAALLEAPVLLRYAAGFFLVA